MASTYYRLPLLISGVIGCHVLYALISESVFYLENTFQYESYAISFFGQLFPTLFAAITFFGSRNNTKGLDDSVEHDSKPTFFLLRWDRAIQRAIGFKAPCWLYIAISFSVSTSILLTNRGSRLLGYPIQVLFKSAKPLWVMGSRHVFLHKRANLIEVGGMLILCGGVALFSFASRVGGGGFSVEGLIVMCLSLTLDATTYMLQEHYAFQRYKAGNAEVIFGYSIVACFVLFVQVLSLGALPSLFYYITVVEPSFCPRLGLLSLFNYAGVNCLLWLIGEFGGNYGSMACTIRKCFTVVASYIFFPKAGS